MTEATTELKADPIRQGRRMFIVITEGSEGEHRIPIKADKCRVRDGFLELLVASFVVATFAPGGWQRAVDSGAIDRKAAGLEKTIEDTFSDIISQGWVARVEMPKKEEGTGNE